MVRNEGDLYPPKTKLQAGVYFRLHMISTHDDYMSIKLGFIGVKSCLTLRLIKDAMY